MKILFVVASLVGLLTSGVFLWTSYVGSCDRTVARLGDVGRCESVGAVPVGTNMEVIAERLRQADENLRRYNH